MLMMQRRVIIRDKYACTDPECCRPMVPWVPIGTVDSEAEATRIIARMLRTDPSRKLENYRLVDLDTNTAYRLTVA